MLEEGLKFILTSEQQLPVTHGRGRASIPIPAYTSSSLLLPGASPTNTSRAIATLAATPSPSLPSSTSPSSVIATETVRRANQPQQPKPSSATKIAELFGQSDSFGSVNQTRLKRCFSTPLAPRTLASSVASSSKDNASTVAEETAAPVLSK
ncbi:unnamed protein product, partial [Protopolystoma xenopodis]